MTPLQLRYITSEFIIYENIEHRALLDRLFFHKQDISKLAIYKFFEGHTNVISEVVQKGTIPPK
jgi:hypothetical protein